MDRHKLIVTVSVLSCLCHGWEVQVPESVKAVEGSCVMLSCHTSPHDEVKWYKYKRIGYPVVYSGNTADIIEEFRGRTSVPGSPSQGNCSLKINNVRKEDNGISLYPWIYPEASNQYKYIKINVVNPEISISVENSPTDGSLFSANCTVQHSCPSSPPPVEWMGLSYISNNVTSTVVSGGRWTLVVHAQFKVNHLDHNRTLSCKSTFNGRSIYSTTVTLDILYAPKDVKIDGADGSVVEGATISLTCTSKSNPEPTDYEWLVTQNSSTTTHRASKSFPLGSVKRDTSVSCTAQNSIGRGQSKQIVLNVHFPPTILVNSVCFGLAGGVRCVCQAEAAPKTNVSWTVNGSSALLPHFSTMTKHAGRITVSELTGPPASNVSCKASNIVGTDTYQMPIQHSVSEVPPSILMNSTCFASAGGVQCVCRAEAEPKANISWMVDGSSAVHPHFNTTTTYAGGIAVSELIGPPASNVSCKASNIVGTDTYQMPILRPPSEGNSGSMVAAVVAVVCIILGIAVAAICLRKRRQHPADSTSRSRTESSGKNIVVNLHDNIYMNNAAGEDIYTNTMDTPQANKDDGHDIYQNY